VVGIIKPSLRRAEIEGARRKRPENLDAYDLYLRALPHFHSVMPEDAKTGVDLLTEALKLDPSYAPAHALMAWALKMRVVTATVTLGALTTPSGGETFAFKEVEGGNDAYINRNHCRCRSLLTRRMLPGSAGSCRAARA
jgi:hypothetical protein